MSDDNIIYIYIMFNYPYLLYPHVYLWAGETFVFWQTQIWLWWSILYWAEIHIRKKCIIFTGYPAHP